VKEHSNSFFHTSFLGGTALDGNTWLFPLRVSETVLMASGPRREEINTVQKTEAQKVSLGTAKETELALPLIQQRCN
jgi:hypothetical protein